MESSSCDQGTRPVEHGDYDFQSIRRRRGRLTKLDLAVAVRKEKGGKEEEEEEEEEESESQLTFHSP